MKNIGTWGELFDFDDDDEFDIPLALDGETGGGIEFLEDAHEALNRLSQKTNKRGRLMRQPRRAESWH